MPGYLLHDGVSATCLHGGQVKVVPSSRRVLVSGQPVATSSDATQVTGCSFNVSGKAQPCTQVRWQAAARVRVNGQPALLQDGSALCQSAEQIPQGPPNVSAGQTRVKGA